MPLVQEAPVALAGNEQSALEQYPLASMHWPEQLRLPGQQEKRHDPPEQTYEPRGVGAGQSATVQHCEFGMQMPLQG
jgi:hypothetical protein